MVEAEIIIFKKIAVTNTMHQHSTSAEVNSSCGYHIMFVSFVACQPQSSLGDLEVAVGIK